MSETSSVQAQLPSLLLLYHPSLEPRSNLVYTLVMTDVINTNPAQRAINFLNEFNQARAGTTSNKQVRHVLATMYDLRVSDTSAHMIVLSDAWKLPVQMRESISMTGLSLDPFEHVIKDLEKVLTTMTLDSSAQVVSNNMPRTLIPSLGMISTVLNKDLPEAMLTEEKIDELLGSIAQLQEDIRTAELDKDFTDFVLHRADSIAYALNHYETLGPNEVMLRVDQMFGGAMRQYGKLANGKEKTGLLHRLMQIGGAIVLALSVANGSIELSENLSKFIESSIQIDADPLINDAPVQDKPTDKETISS